MTMDIGAQALSDYIFASKYANLTPEGRLETYEEAVNRVMGMHVDYYTAKGKMSMALASAMGEADMFLLDKHGAGSQRNMQYGGRAVLRTNLRSFNCAGHYCDRPRFFAETLWMLLCGCGVGFSVQKHHVEKLPKIFKPDFRVKTHVVEDSIEGWADALDALTNSYFNMYGATVEFDYTRVRSKGSPISTTSGKAPGPEPLRKALEAVRKVLDSRVHTGALRPIDAYDIVMHASGAVLSGGVRRSATIALFSHDDEEMLNAKSGDWFATNPQRAQSNNSAMLLRGETTFEQFDRYVEIARVGGGEPGFIWTDSLDFVVNPCAEVSFYPQIDGQSGVQTCNLTTINAASCVDKADFLQRARAAAILGTLQAGYTDFGYLGDVSKRITEREALLGVSITGIQDNPHVALDAEVLLEGVRVIKRTNEEIAALIGINPAARLTVIKPEGTTSSYLGTAAGKHARHAQRYVRRVQANLMEPAAQSFMMMNPHAFEMSEWKDGDVVLKFPIESPADALLRRDESALSQLADVVFL